MLMTGPIVGAPKVETALVKEMLRRSVLTLVACPDPDLRYRLGAKNNWPPIVQEMRDAYGAVPPKVKTFHPTSHDLSMFLDMLGTLGWYGREWNQETVRIFRAWVLGAAMWQLQERCSTNRRRPAAPNTVHNRINAMVAAISSEFPEVILRHRLDGLHELLQKDRPDEHDGKNIPSSDARDLPKTDNHFVAPQALMSVVEKRDIRRKLEKTLKRNKSRAIGRQQRAARS